MPLMRPADENGPQVGALPRRLRWLPTPRGWAVLVFGLTTLGRGLVYVLGTEPPSPALEVIAENYPRALYGWAWVAVGTVCLVSLVLRRWRLALSLVSGLYFAWSVSALTVWFAMRVETALGAGLLYLALGTAAAAISAMQDPAPRGRRNA